MSFISIFRLFALGLSLLLGLVDLGLAAHWLQLSPKLPDGVGSFEVVPLVAGIFTLLSLPMMLVVGIIRRGAFTSMVAVELAVLTVLWVLYLAAGARTADVKDRIFPFGCDDAFLTPTGQSLCPEFFGILGLSFVVWIVLFLYTVTLLVFALIGQSRGNTVWTASVDEANFLAQPVGVPVHNPAAAAHVPVYAPQQYPMVQQQMGPAPGHSGMPQI